MSRDLPHIPAKRPLLLNSGAERGAHALSMKGKSMMTRFAKPAVAAALILGLSAASPALSKPSLRDVPEIENSLFSIAIADEVRDQCDGINARLLKAIGQLRALKARANDLGYSDDEIRAYVESDGEKARMRAKGEAFLKQNGVRLDAPETFCAFGHAEIAKNSAIGALLRAR
tara:strand:- start:811 stop:1329 length:519 start_codon:yes stop_codon:yes gene_type:complete